jgi:hypothetical protein
VTLDLGGPGVGCSAMRVRRLIAGELVNPERERTETHVAECSRCQKTARELQEENLVLRRDLPFPVFAAGVAEKLAQQRKPRVAQWMSFAAAASVLLVGGSMMLRSPEAVHPVEPPRTTQSKGGPLVQLFVQDARGTRSLAAGEAVANGAKLRLSLHPGERKFAAAVLLEQGEESVLYNGPALNGPLPEAFEWTGTAREAQLLVVLSDQAIDAAKLQGAEGARGIQGVPQGADVIELVLRR